MNLAAIWRWRWATVLLCAWVADTRAQPAPAYTNGFSAAEIGKAPADMIVLDGGFAVREEAGNRFLELPGAPLDSFGILFGASEKEGVAVSARIQGTAKGRRFPSFGVGLGGAGGYRLILSPGKKALELFKGDDLKAQAPAEWTSGQWTQFRLRLRALEGGGWRVEGRVWTQGTPEPAPWPIAWDEKDAPRPGKAGVFGCPFSGTPIRFDDLAVDRLQ